MHVIRFLLRFLNFRAEFTDAEDVKIRYIFMRGIYL